MTTIGFIGLGVMGRPMALNLVRAGFPLTVHSRSPEPVAALREAGATPASSPAEVAAAADVVITMLPDSAAVRSVVTGERGVLSGARAGSLFVDMSTIHPAVAQELAAAAREHDLGALDAPVSGGDVGARQGTLSIMVGGAEEDFARARPVFEALGTTIVHVGGPGAGQTVKACNQVVVALSLQAVSEALVLGSKAGVDPERILEVLSGGLAANRVMEVRRRNFLEHDFTPGFRVDLHHKDLGIALETAGEINAALPATALVQQLFQALRARGEGGRDHSALLSVVEELSRHRLGTPEPTSEETRT